MFQKFAEALLRIQNRFTYHERFVFFAVIYIVLMPIPSYWMTRTYQYEIGYSNLRLSGVERLLLTGSIYNRVTLYLITLVAKEKGSQEARFEEKNIQKSIDEGFAKLTEIPDIAAVDLPPSLTYGFSKSIVPENDYEAPLLLWGELKQAETSLSLKETVEGYHQLLRLLKKSFENIEYNYGMLLDNNLNIQNLFDFLVYQLPETTEAVAKSSINFLSKKNLSTLSTSVPIYTHILEQILGPDTLEENNAQRDSLRKSILKEQDALSNFFSTIENPINLTPTRLFSNAKKSLDSLLDLRVHANNFAKELVMTEKERLLREKHFSVGLLIACTVFVGSIVMFRFLTKHLQKMVEHIQELAKGKFLKCFSSNVDDDFGQVGLAFDAVTDNIEEVVKELHMLGTLLSTFTGQVNKTTKEQQKTVEEQESGLLRIEATASDMVASAKNLAKEMNDLHLLSKKTLIAEEAKRKLDEMQKKMASLKLASKTIIDKLVPVQEKVSETSALIDIMASVSDEAKLLSLNAAIETATVRDPEFGLGKISSHIERFSLNTASSTQDMQRTIIEMAHTVSKARQEATRGMKEISEGATRLISVSHQLTAIARQGDEQDKQFEKVNQTMQEQDLAGITMIESIAQLSEAAGRDIHSLKNLYQTVSEIAVTTEKLQLVLDRFAHNEGAQ